MKFLPYFIVAILASSVSYFVTKKYFVQTTTVPNTTNNSICSDYSSLQPNTLQVALIKDMTKRYRKNQLASINASQNINDAYSIWFSLEELKTFLYHTESLYEKNKTTTTSKNLGVRIYYSAYPEKANWGKFPDLVDYNTNVATKDYGELHTVIMVPTIATDKGNNSDFNPTDISTFANGLDLTNANYSTISLTGNATGNKTNAKNHAKMVPPGTAAGLAF